MWDSVPWFVGGGAQHSPEVARLFAYAAANGAEGAVTPGDLRVTPLDVPGGAVRVLPGAGFVLNRSAGGGQQMYVARLPIADQVEIAPTGSGSGRSDLIVAQIEDPFQPGEPWQVPADPTAGPYVFTRVISNVPAGTTRLQDVPGYEGRSALTLARIDLPASTGTVTEEMITDPRNVANPKSDRFFVNATMPGGIALTGGSYTDWPDGGITVNVPEWATTATIAVDFLVVMNGPNANGDFRLMAGQRLVRTQRWNVDTAAGASERVTMKIAGTTPLILSPGGTLNLKVQGRRLQGSGYLATREDTTYIFDVEFRGAAA